ncbi:UNVERIFIED_CONTAM: hypothetical protein K2H54_060696, partial [Gekko kuhli]
MGHLPPRQSSTGVPTPLLVGVPKDWWMTFVTHVCGDEQWLEHFRISRAALGFCCHTQSEFLTLPPPHPRLEQLLNSTAIVPGYRALPDSTATEPRFCSCHAQAGSGSQTLPPLAFQE